MCGDCGPEHIHKRRVRLFVRRQVATAIIIFCSRCFRSGMDSMRTGPVLDGCHSPGRDSMSSGRDHILYQPRRGSRSWGRRPASSPEQLQVGGEREEGASNRDVG